MFPGQSQANLPQPDADALRHSEQLRQLIAAAIDAAGGALPFSQFMQMALYEPGLGYYSAGSVKFGAAGDFVTAVDQGDFLARAITATLAPQLAQHARPIVVEVGAGSGQLAHDMLRMLDAKGLGEVEYQILEPSPELRVRQQKRLAEAGARVSWIETLEPGSVTGAVIANEVLDALPVDRVQRSGAGWRQLAVARDGSEFIWRNADLNDAQSEQLRTISAQLPEILPEGFVTEIRPLLAGWIAALGAALHSGEILLIDYGLSRREYFHRQRAEGTLMCHYRHRAHSDPFIYPGLQDITAWVDFSECAYAAQAAGLHVAGYATQGSWMLESLQADMADTAGAPMDIQAAAQLRTLLLPGEMGERFKALLLRRFSEDAARDGLPGRDLRSRLW